jgi:hypothetical protein
MAHFEKIFHPLFSPESADGKALDGLQRAGTYFFGTHCFLKYYSLGVEKNPRLAEKPVPGFRRFVSSLYLLKNIFITVI